MRSTKFAWSSGTASPGPRADQGLVKQIFLVGVGHRSILDLLAVRVVHAAPALDRRTPVVGDLGKNVDAGADVLAALGVVSG